MSAASVGSDPKGTSRPSAYPSPSVSASGSARTVTLLAAEGDAFDVPAVLVATSVNTPDLPAAMVIVKVAEVPAPLIERFEMVIAPEGANVNVEPPRFAPVIE